MGPMSSLTRSLRLTRVDLAAVVARLGSALESRTGGPASAVQGTVVKQ